MRLGVCGAVAAAHGLAVWALSLSTSISRTPPSLEILTATLIQTNDPARRSVRSAPLVTRAMVLQDPTEPVLNFPSPPIIEVVESNTAAISVAPQMLDSTPPDVAPYARRAGLLPGESAFVVLRVEVLPDGHVGQVQVDISSGSSQVDAVASDYVRKLVWLPGRVHGIDESTWVRYGVRLAA